jgi:hypothetical protein
MFHRIQDYERFLDSVIFSDEVTFHVSGKVNTHNCRILVNPRVSLEHVGDSPKVNVIRGPFFVMEKTITGIVYLGMLQQFLMPQLDEDDQGGCIHFQQDGAPPHFFWHYSIVALPLEVTVNHNYPW